MENIECKSGFDQKLVQLIKKRVKIDQIFELKICKVIIEFYRCSVLSIWSVLC